MKSRLRQLVIGLHLSAFGWIVLSMAGCESHADQKINEAETTQIKVPPGFLIEVWADGLPRVRSLRLGGAGVVYASTGADKVYALKYEGDAAPRVYVVAQGLHVPNGIAWRNGDLYVAEIERILRYPGLEKNLAKPPAAQVVRADLPREGHHGARYIAFGPDGKLYMGIGAPCNVCEPAHFQRDGRDLEYGSITRMNPDGTQWETVARGVRNSVGFDWRPGTGELWFTDNGRDMMGDDLPSCELNRLGKPGQHFGFPYCQQGDVVDDQFGAGKSCKDYVPPAAKLGAHVAPLGMRFYTGTMFPPAYRGQIFVAKHGSWNRSKKSGYTVNLVRLDAAGKVVADEVFVGGWLKNEQVFGRPVDVLAMPDGALLVSDDLGGRIYRISYQP